MNTHELQIKAFVEGKKSKKEEDEMVKRYELAGMFAVFMALFASVGLSGWTYGNNLIENGDFALNASWYNSDFSNCSAPYAITSANNWWNSSGAMVINASNTASMDYLASSYFNMTKGSIYRVYYDFSALYEGSLDFALTEAPNDGGYITFTLVHKDDACSAMTAELEHNSTLARQYPATTPLQWASYQISDLGGGWFRIITSIDTDAWADMPDGESEYMFMMYPYHVSENNTKAVIALDNVAVQDAVYVCEGWECPSTTKTVVELAPIVFGLAVIIMSFMWMLSHEGEDFISAVINVGIVYIFLAVMFVIIYMILG